MRRPPRWHLPAAAIVGTLTVVFLTVTVFRAIALHQAAAALLGATPVVARAGMRTARRAGAAAPVALGAMDTAFMIWMYALGRQLRRHGHGGLFRTLRSWRPWQVGLVVALLMSLLLRAPRTGDSLRETGAFYHRGVWFCLVDAAVAVLNLWVLADVWRSVGRILSGPPRLPDPVPGQVRPADDRSAPAA
jgi:hypothetical protein